MTRPFFTRERINDFDIYDKHCATTLQLARTRLAEGYPIEFQVNLFSYESARILKAAQDLVARFTLDSATEFLFGHDVGSLTANIPYPPSVAHLNQSSFYNHPSTIFVKAFSEGQKLIVARSSLGNDWPLLEFWSDKVAPFRKVIDNFTEPLMEEALAKRKLELSKKATDTKDDESDNLLGHLVKHTQGKESSLNILSAYLMFFLDALDKEILKDEVI